MTRWRISRSWHVDRMDPVSGKTATSEFGDTVDFDTERDAAAAAKRFRLFPGEWLPRGGAGWEVSSPMPIRTHDSPSNKRRR